MNYSLFNSCSIQTTSIEEGKMGHGGFGTQASEIYIFSLNTYNRDVFFYFYFYFIQSRQLSVSFDLKNYHLLMAHLILNLLKYNYGKLKKTYSLDYAVLNNLNFNLKCKLNSLVILIRLQYIKKQLKYFIVFICWQHFLFYLHKS